jgi:elongation factor Ts
MNNDIIKLREITKAGVIECKKALEEAGGNFEKALQIITERGLLRAEERKERKTGAAGIFSYIHNNRIGVLLKMSAETDFVVKSDIFKNLANEILMQIAATNPGSVDELLKSVYIRDDAKQVENVIKEVISKTGENINIEQFARFEV